MNYWNKLVEFLIGPQGSDGKTPVEKGGRKPKSKTR